MTAIAVDAPAKINLHLHIVGRRPDGYHLLDSLVAFAGVGDTIEAREDAGLSLIVEGPIAADLAGEPDNLVLRAVRTLADRVGRPADVAVRLIKRLPVASGIGGGSADAAATLRAVAALWGLPSDAPVLSAVAPTLGADVPVCLAGRASNMSGIGECLDPAPTLPPAWLVLVNPRVACSTPAVFRARTGPFSAPDPVVRDIADAVDLAGELGRRRNDLTDAALTVAPVIADVLARLAAAPDCLMARMSGSGATCFGLYGGQQAAMAAATRLQAERPGWWVVASDLLSRPVGGR